jgi:transposase
MKRGRPFRVEWREGDTAEALRAATRRERDGRARERLRGLWLLRTGRSLEEVAAVLGVHYRTVQRWVGWYRAEGLAGVHGHQPGGSGPAPRLSPGQEAHLAEVVSTGTFRTAGEIRDWIAAEFGVEYQLGGVYTLLGRLRCAPKVPRPLHAKADLAEQARWKKGA